MVDVGKNQSHLEYNVVLSSYLCSLEIRIYLMNSAANINIALKMPVDFDETEIT